MKINRLTSTLLFFAVSTTQALLAQTIAGQPNGTLPDHVAYRHLFRHISALNKMAKEREQQGKDGEVLRHLLHNQANLTRENTQALDEVTREYEKQSSELDTKAQRIITAYRAQYPGGKVPHGEKPRPIPSELKQLQAQRNAVAITLRDRLKVSLGDQEFAKFDGFVKRKVSSDWVPATTEAATN